MNYSRKRFLSSMIVLTLCITMFIGTTFAWFTDNVTSSRNIIKSGNLDIEMYWTDDLDSGTWYNVEDPEHNTIFDYDNWEPGYTEVRYIKIVNNGNLAFNYHLALTPMGEVGKLAEVINVFYANDGVKVEDREDLSNMNSIGLLKNVMDGGATAKGTLLTKKQQSPLHKSGEEIITIAMNMITTAGNEYQNESVGDGFTITTLATQCPYEEDSFGNDYDSNAKYPAIIAPGKVSVAVSPENGVIPAGGVTLSGEGLSATVPAGVAVVDGTDRMTLTVKPLEHTTTDITTVNSEILIPVDVHVSGVAEDNTVPIIINLGEIMPQYLNMGNYTLFHVEDGVNNAMTYVEWDEELTAHNQFKYDPMTGEVIVAMASFSEVAVLADTDNAWNGTVAEAFSGGSGTEAEPYIIANADQLAYMGDRVSNDNTNYGSACYQLIADLNFGGEANDETIWYPIGYNKVGGEVATVALTDDLDEIYFEPISYSAPGDKDGDVVMTMADNSWYTYGGSFKGVFDGMGHTITGIYQNTWAMKGNYDGNYYNAAMGLFGYVNGGTVKNLTIDNFYSEGEFAPTGCVTAYAGGSATFENIAITNSHPQTYNTGVAGIVGWDNGNSSNFTFKNITVDDKNTMSALWGSWDVAASGILGCLKNGSTASFENCNVAATIDVYNDVCGNYQYYWYRYSGAFIGTVYKRLDSGKGALDLSDVTATNCTVNFGDRHEYYYCEFEKNTQASYTEDYQFSRVPHEELNMDVNPITCKHTHTANEDKQAVYIPYRQLFGGYGWGVDGIDLGEYENIEISDITTSQVKFETKFENFESYLYRVGNENTVSVGTLFKAKDGATINTSGVYVTIDKVDENSNVSGTFTANTSDWTKGTIQFTGTGVVKVTIQDYKYCAPTVLYLEVIDAMNATKATSATSNDVVLLQDVSGTFTVSNGHTFYGNGFTVTLPTSSVQNVGSGFTGYISIGASQDDGIANGGNLDNVRIEGPVYPEMYIYRDQAKITDSSDSDYGDGYNMRYFKNSVIVYGGNCTISNSYISGSRTALCLRGGNNVVIENTTLSGGAYANMQICAGSSVTLRDLTTVQTDVTDSYGKNKTAHGLGIAVDSNVVDIYIEGELKQYNWLCEEQWNSIVPSDYQSAFPKFFTSSSFNNYWHYLDGGSEPYVNMAFIYACNWDTAKIHDNRTSVDYETCDATIAGVSGGVYSKSNSSGNAIKESDLLAPSYKAPGFNPIAPKLNFDNTMNEDADDTNDAADTYCVYDEASGTLKIGLTDDTKTIDLSGVTITKNGVTLEHTVYLNETQINGDTITINTDNGTRQTLKFKTVSTDAGYDVNGKPIARSIEYTWTITIEIATLAYPAPVWNMGGTYKFDTSNCVYAYYSTSQGYGEAVPIYEGIKINYYNKSGALVNLDLSGTTTLPTGSENSNSNAFTYTLADGSVLTMKYSSGWKSGATTHQFTTYNNKVYVYPQSLDNDNYVRAKTTNQDFDVKISYTFTDPNGQSTGTQTMQWYNAMASNGSVGTVQWKTFDSTNGKKASICVTPDTLVTLADGSKKEIQYVSLSEQVLAWNFEIGEYTTVPVSLIQTHGTGMMDVLKLHFEDGTELKVLGEHGIFDADLNTFIFIDQYDVDKYVGHKFVKQDGDSYKTVELVGYEVFEEHTTAYTILSMTHYNVLLEDMFTVTPAHVGDNFFNPFEIYGGMKYDQEAMQKDIEKYGLYTYEEFAHVLTKEQFEALNIAQFKVSEGKGLITYEGLVFLIENFVNNEEFNK